jgi:hypothetical protein
VIEYALHTLISGNAGVAALVGTRVYMEQAVQGVAFPFIVISPSGGDHLQSMAGSSGLETLNVNITATARRYDTARNVIEAVRLAIQGYSGTVESTTFQSILTVGHVTSGFNDPIDSSEIGTFSLTQAYDCSAVEAKPSFA